MTYEDIKKVTIDISGNPDIFKNTTLTVETLYSIIDHFCEKAIEERELAEFYNEDCK